MVGRAYGFRIGLDRSRILPFKGGGDVGFSREISAVDCAARRHRLRPAGSRPRAVWRRCGGANALGLLHGRVEQLSVAGDRRRAGALQLQHRRLGMHELPHPDTVLRAGHMRLSNPGARAGRPLFGRRKDGRGGVSTLRRQGLRLRSAARRMQSVAALQGRDGLTRLRAQLLAAIGGTLPARRTAESGVNQSIHSPLRPGRMAMTTRDS